MKTVKQEEISAMRQVFREAGYPTFRLDQGSVECDCVMLPAACMPQIYGVAAETLPPELSDYGVLRMATQKVKGWKEKDVSADLLLGVSAGLAPPFRRFWLLYELLDALDATILTVIRSANAARGEMRVVQQTNDLSQSQKREYLATRKAYVRAQIILANMLRLTAEDIGPLGTVQVIYDMHSF